jgi:hypothetical protein
MYILKEIGEEHRIVLAGRSGYVDAFLPSVLFVFIHSLYGVQTAIWTALALSAMLVVYRLHNHQSVLNAVSGGVGVILVLLVVTIWGREEGYFVPSIVSGGITLYICVLSLLINRPIVALTSFITR